MKTLYARVAVQIQDASEAKINPALLRLGVLQFRPGPKDPPGSKFQAAEWFSLGSHFEVRHSDGRVAKIDINRALTVACDELFVGKYVLDEGDTRFKQLEERIKNILKPMIDVEAPYAKQAILALVDCVFI